MRSIITIILVGFAVLLSAQSAAPPTTAIDERLYATYEADYLLNLQQQHPVLLQRLNYYLDHAWYITTYPAEKKMGNLPTVRIADPRTVNILELERDQNIRRDLHRQVIYQIENSDQILVYHSAQRFTADFNQFRPTGKK